ncbi:paraquat-inducible protein A [Methylobacter sp. YRD-M1]|uniref:paraquat-inducible protein A n=1 Tax=Methylobacter sp. YRD-M1 TaxID=2911520 RepID=UPI00227A6CF4|nr:paraquat-inducible protein A [Methylobacter sp. YRD-M1]WAK04115.1 paraquat-inducible protein A [Methylobacter sp. YRD-M1]
MSRIELDACAECDLLLNPAQPAVGDKAQCPRCGYLLQRPRKQSIERTFALSVAGLILILPANLLPLVGIKLLGNTRDGTLWSGVATLYQEDMWAVAILVFLSSILFPLVNIALSLLVSGHLYFRKPNRYLPRWMRWLQHIEEWAMLEVYTLGIIVACVKLASMAELRFGFGLYAFVALLIVNAMLASSLDQHLFWRCIEQLRHKNSL